MANQFDKCEDYQMGSTNDNTSASAKLVADTMSAPPSKDILPPSATTNDAPAALQSATTNDAPAAVPAAITKDAPATLPAAGDAPPKLQAAGDAPPALQPAAAAADLPSPPQAAAVRAEVVVAPAPMPVHEHKFHGLNFGLFKIGIKGHSLDLGLNVGVAKTEFQVGQENRVDAGVHLGPLAARGGVGLGFNRDGLHSDVGGRFHAAKLVDTGAEVQAKLGPKTGVHADTGAKVLFAHTRHTFDTSVGEDGFNNGYKGEVGLAKAIGVQANGHANLNDDSSVGGDVRSNLAQSSISAGADLNTQGNTVINPDVHVASDSGEEKARVDVGAQVGPKLDVRAGTAYDTTDKYNDWRTGSVSVGVGQSGIGAQATRAINGQQQTAKAGWGPDYMADF